MCPYLHQTVPPPTPNIVQCKELPVSPPKIYHLFLILWLLFKTRNYLFLNWDKNVFINIWMCHYKQQTRSPQPSNVNINAAFCHFLRQAKQHDWMLSTRAVQKLLRQSLFFQRDWTSFKTTYIVIKYYIYGVLEWIISLLPLMVMIQ